MDGAVVEVVQELTPTADDDAPDVVNSAGDVAKAAADEAAD